MIGRTNAQCFGASGAVDGVTVADLPTCPKSISAASNSGKIIISLEYSDTDLVSGVDVVYKAGDYPTSPTDGDVVTTSGAAESVTVSGLTNGTKYFFRVYLFRTIGGVKYFQTDDTNAKVFATPSAVGIDGMTPAIVGDNYLVIAQSGMFTMSIPENLTVTAYLVGGGSDGVDGDPDYDHYCSGGYGGRFIAQTLSSGKVACISAVGARTRYKDKGSDTTLKFGTTSYTTNGGTQRAGGTSFNGVDGLSTPYGYVGSSGGNGSGYSSGYQGGAGAGDGGYRDENGDGTNGEDAINYGCGGGGGGEPRNEDRSSGSEGYGKQGAIIIGWE